MASDRSSSTRPSPSLSTPSTGSSSKRPSPSLSTAGSTKSSLYSPSPSLSMISTGSSSIRPSPSSSMTVSTPQAPPHMYSQWKGHPRSMVKLTGRRFQGCSPFSYRPSPTRQVSADAGTAAAAATNASRAAALQESALGAHRQKEVWSVMEASPSQVTDSTARVSSSDPAAMPSGRTAAEPKMRKSPWRYKRETAAHGQWVPPGFPLPVRRGRGGSPAGATARGPEIA